MARVAGVNAASASATSGTKPAAAWQGRGTVSMPSKVRAIWWLKYHGAGSITASPVPAMAVIAMLNARLQPAVIATSAAATVAP